MEEEIPVQSKRGGGPFAQKRRRGGPKERLGREKLNPPVDYTGHSQKEVVLEIIVEKPAEVKLPVKAASRKSGKRRCRQ